MNDDKKEIAEILKIGIKTEIDGQNFYSTLAGKIKNPDARRKIERLAADEIAHEQVLRKLYEEFVGGQPGELPPHGLTIFKDAFGDRPLQEADKFKLLDLAMDAELRAARFYKEGENKTHEPKLRRIFAELVAQEDGHYNLLVGEREALRGNIDWFSYDSTAMMED